MTRHSAVLLLAIATVPIAAQGQSVFVGRVLTDSGVAIAGAEVFLNGPKNIQRTNERGEFRFIAVPAGDHIVGVRMTGFAPKIDTIGVADAGEVRLDVMLTKIEATLPEVSVTASALDRKLVEFHERRRMGIGRFLDSAEFANARGTRTSDRLKKLAGLKIGRGRFLNEAYVLSTRQPGRLALGGGLCRAAIWLDGVKLTDFNVNELDPSLIAAVEWYAGPASVPAKFNVTSAVCGVLVIWTR
ncbi:MAG TPA: carboxypeptidase regulatory-like domain-containing protein [Gemmatimonadaceae bacterium]